MTLEQGGTTFKDDQSVFQSPARTNFGNVLTPIFGQTLDLTSLLGRLRDPRHQHLQQGLFTANATSWLDLYGQFLYSQPDTTLTISRGRHGQSVLAEPVLFYTSQQYLVSAAAKLPHTTGSLGAEIRPFRRVRIVESWLTDRLHNSGSAASDQTLAGLGVLKPDGRAAGFLAGDELQPGGDRRLLRR